MRVCGRRRCTIYIIYEITKSVYVYNSEGLTVCTFYYVYILYICRQVYYTYETAEAQIIIIISAVSMGNYCDNYNARIYIPKRIKATHILRFFLYLNIFVQLTQRLVNLLLFFFLKMFSASGLISPVNVSRTSRTTRYSTRFH